MSAQHNPNAPAQSHMIGVCVRYCFDDGTSEDVWVDIKQVRALAWGNEDVKERKAGLPHGHNHVPGTPHAPQCLPQQTQARFSTVGAMAAGSEASEEGVCWWDGTQWICGD